ncbi:MAG: hypothetical protein K0S55_1786 [Clostridia bacterium]|nr:hypothetical protein [Clostridia bacterium]
MKIEIRKLKPDLLEEAHTDNDDEDRCYYVGWCNAKCIMKTPSFDFGSADIAAAAFVLFSIDNIAF